MTKSAMEALPKHVSKHGAPEASTSAYGPLLYEKELKTGQGGAFSLFFVNSLTFLFHDSTPMNVVVGSCLPPMLLCP